jgi:neutral ceramidase
MAGRGGIVAVCMSLMVLGSVSMGANDSTPAWKAGVATVVITPEQSMWMAGYAARTKPSEGKVHDLNAKALALEDARGTRFVIVTMDLIGFPREFRDSVEKQVSTRYGLRPEGLLLSVSHTHCGPEIRAWRATQAWDLPPEQIELGSKYAEDLQVKVIDLVGQALKDLLPAQLSYMHGRAGVAMNRRLLTERGYVISPNADGPVDHDVPVLLVTTPDAQKTLAILFGYACHNTTLGGEFYQIDGDYAGAAQREIESVHPGATALFMMLCGGDQNPRPRGTTALAEQHGRSLAGAVDRVLAGKLERVRPPIRSSYEVTRLDFAPHTRETFEQEAKTPNVFKQRRAKLMLEAYDKGQPIRQVSYPVQAIRLRSDLTFLALGGEVVVDYSLRTRREFPKENLIVAGYCNDVMCYLPSRRVLLEGGYEPDISMIYYGQPGPFRDDVEERIFQAVHSVLKRVGAASEKPGK